MIKELNASNFNEEVLKSSVPVLVDFWASWCGPCKIIAPVIDELFGEYGDKIKFAKVNVDESPDVASRYGVMSIPTVFIFSGGNILSQIVGVQTKIQFKKRLDEALANK
jgi:thioredoxin 1